MAGQCLGGSLRFSLGKPDLVGLVAIGLLGFLLQHRARAKLNHSDTHELAVGVKQLGHTQLSSY